MPDDLACFHAGGGAQVQMQVALADACRTKANHASGTLSDNIAARRWENTPRMVPRYNCGSLPRMPVMLKHTMLSNASRLHV